MLVSEAEAMAARMVGFSLWRSKGLALEDLGLGGWALEDWKRCVWRRPLGLWGEDWGKVLSTGEWRVEDGGVLLEEAVA